MFMGSYSYDQCAFECIFSKIRSIVLVKPQWKSSFRFAITTSLGIPYKSFDGCQQSHVLTFLCQMAMLSTMMSTLTTLRDHREYYCDQIGTLDPQKVYFIWNFWLGREISEYVIYKTTMLLSTMMSTLTTLRDHCVDYCDQNGTPRSPE